MIDNFVNNLKEKYGYPDELCIFLKELIPALVTYYGDDKLDLIINALDNCEIIDNNKFFGHFHYKAQIDNGNLNIKYEIRLYKDFISSKSTLIHEICHLIKTYNRYVIKDDNLTVYCGLIEDSYKYNSEIGDFESLHSKHTMFEEMFNEEDTLQIDNILGIKYPDGVYRFKGEAETFINSNLELYEAIRQSQFGDPKSWLKFIPEEIKEEVIGMYNVEGNGMGSADNFMKFICRANEKQNYNKHSK